MSNNQLQVYFSSNTTPGLKYLTIKISHHNAINKLWYILYKIDQLILENATICDNIHNKVCDVLEESFDDNNYLEYTKYKLSNSTIPVIKGGQDPEVIYNSSIENYSEFIDYISNISYLHTPSYRDNTYININNTMSFKYNFAKPQTYTFILRFEILINLCIILQRYKI